MNILEVDNFMRYINLLTYLFEHMTDKILPVTGPLRRPFPHCLPQSRDAIEPPLVISCERRSCEDAHSRERSLIAVRRSATCRTP